MITRIGILNISDRASQGIYEDIPGKKVKELLNSWLTSPWDCVYEVIPDDQPVIEEKLIQFADISGCSLILTTGGTGPSPRDVTPEATMAVCPRLYPGFGEQMRAVSLQYVPTAILSRQTAGSRGRCLIVNLPGKPKAVEECLAAVFPAIPYAIELLEGPILTTDSSIMPAFRPKSA